MKAMGKLSMDDIYRRYYLAGGCARLFFTEEQDELVERLDNFLARCTDKRSLLQGLTAVSDTGTSNTLLSVFEGHRACLVSEYVALRVAEAVDDSDFSEVEHVWASNTAWQGWVLELKFVNFAKRHRLKLTQASNGVLSDYIMPIMNVQFIMDE